MGLPTTAHNHQYVRNIPKYFIYTAFKGFGFGLFTAIWLVYLQQQRGVTLAQATIIDVAFWIAATLGEIPTGIVADVYGRKVSLIIGSAVLGLSVLMWAVAPTIPLIILAYVFLALGTTFLSGAEDALFFETIQITGRGEDYTRLLGRVGAVLLVETAVGNVVSGLAGSINLIFPFLAAALSLAAMMVVALTFKEPRAEQKAGGQARQSYRATLRQSITIMRERPSLRYSVFYLTLLPLVALVMETFFLQPQSIALGIPVAGVGFVVMAVQIVNMGGSTLSARIKAYFGEKRIFYSAPAFIVISLILLAVFQFIPALIFIGIISFVTAALRPILTNRIQLELPDEIRATVLSFQSLMFTGLLAVSEPVLGLVADKSGLPSAYWVLAGTMGILSLFLLWKSRRHLITPTPTTEPLPDSQPVLAAT